MQGKQIVSETIRYASHDGQVIKIFQIIKSSNKIRNFNEHSQLFQYVGVQSSPEL